MLAVSKVHISLSVPLGFWARDLFLVLLCFSM